MAILEPSRLIVYLFIWAMSIGVTQAVVTDQFKYWYSQFGASFERTKNQNCSAQYERYVTGDTENNTIDHQGGGDEFSVLTQPLIDCILSNTSEFIKANMTGAQVLLGVMPTVLSLLSASVDELAMVIAVGRRPLLGLLLAFGSPSAFFSRAFSYDDAASILHKKKDRLSQWRPSSRIWLAVISALEYLVVFALAANVLHCAWEVGIRAVSSILSNSAFLPPFWVGSGAFVQLMGAGVFRLRVQGWRDSPIICLQRSIEKENRTHHGWASFPKWLRRTPRRLKGLWRTELVPAMSRDLEVRVATYPERKMFVVSSWFQSNFAVLHVVFGTLAFSNMLFVGTIDAFAIVSRFFISTLVCRIIIRYELAGLREACVAIQSAEEPGEQRDYFQVNTGYGWQMKTAITNASQGSNGDVPV